ncbi:unnamed protein product [Ambrosiozyma monospora]|uniref:Unnamed protein product n=1 Tax=Ambrosiozyma monospora TaxID=43982 RepID=A0ACB5U973_AMBMO|nr:unnamed protein product [Ambrosiozyma monospora]
MIPLAQNVALYLSCSVISSEELEPLICGDVCSSFFGTSNFDNTGDEDVGFESMSGVGLEVAIAFEEFVPGESF